MLGIGTRLQRQRAHAKGRNSRGKQRTDWRGYPDDGQPWGQKGWASGALPSFPATHGAPGSGPGVAGVWGPIGATPPTSVANLIAGVPNVVTAIPITKWPIGAYVQTGTAGAPGQAYWNGTAWTLGQSPGLATVLDGTIDDVKAYVNALGDDEWRDNIIQELVDFERGHQNRATLVSWLDQQTGVE